MNRRHVGTVVTMGMLLASCGAAAAMQPAGTQGGFQAGAEVGGNVAGRLRFGAGADVDLGFHTNLLGQGYTDGVVDVLTTGKFDTDQWAVRVGGRQAIPLSGSMNFETHMWVVTAGIRQPLPISRSIPISVEGGLSYLHVSDGATVSATGPFLGARATFGKGSTRGLTAMARYHFENGGFYQLGGGISGPVPRRKGLSYQVDIYHLGGPGIPQSDVIMFGIRWGGKL